MNDEIFVAMIAIWIFSLIVVIGIMRDNTKHDIEEIIERKLQELKNPK